MRVQSSQLHHAQHDTPRAKKKPRENNVLEGKDHKKLNPLGFHWKKQNLLLTVVSLQAHYLYSQATSWIGTFIFSESWGDADSQFTIFGGVADVYVDQRNQQSADKLPMRTSTAASTTSFFLDDLPSLPWREHRQEASLNKIVSHRHSHPCIWKTKISPGIHNRFSDVQRG